MFPVAVLPQRVAPSSVCLKGILFIPSFQALFFSPFPVAHASKGYFQIFFFSFSEILHPCDFEVKTKVVMHKRKWESQRMEDLDPKMMMIYKPGLDCKITMDY